MAHTGFKAEENGFAFVNSWQFDTGEQQQLRHTLVASSGERDASSASGLGGLLRNRIAPQIEQWVESILPDYYGMCGGMAFAAADYYAAGRPLPRGKGYSDTPTPDTPRGQVLRDYLWQRQIQSLQLNAGQLLYWMAMLHLPEALPFAGADWLLDRVRDEEWPRLKNHIDAGHPWPLCLIGSSPSPFNNHQVLAVGYDDWGDGTGVISVYDMNGPGKEQTITLDMRGKTLAAVESLPNPARGPLRAFFCERYSPAPLPDLPDEMSEL